MFGVFWISVVWFYVGGMLLCFLNMFCDYVWGLDIFFVGLEGCMLMGVFEVEVWFGDYFVDFFDVVEDGMLD